MSAFLMIAAIVVLASGAIGLIRVLGAEGGRSKAAERMMAGQLLGTAGIGALLLVGTATAMPAAVDLALLLAMLAPFAVIGLASVEGGAS
jgi:multicomponent Na+:H+ antiporter subunit F